MSAIHLRWLIRGRVFSPTLPYRSVEVRRRRENYTELQKRITSVRKHLTSARQHDICHLDIFQKSTCSHDLQCDSTLLQQGGQVIKGTEDVEAGDVVVVQHCEAFIAPVLYMMEKIEGRGKK
jgi:hypothetical protein